MNPNRAVDPSVSRRSRRALQCAVTGAALLAGCVNQHREIQSYRQVLDGKQPISSLRTDYSHGERLTLEAALLLANRGYEQLDIQGEAYLQSLIERERAYSAFIPTISLAPNLTWQNKRSTSGVTTTGGTGTGGTGTGTGGTGTGTGGSTGTVVTTTGGASSNRYTSFEAPIQAQAQFNVVQDLSAIRAAYANTDQYRNLLLDLQQTVLLETAQAYYQTLLAERSVEVLENSVQFQDARVADMQGRLRAGIAQPLDVAQTEAQAAATRAQLVTARNTVATDRLTLALMTDADVARATLVDRLSVPDALMPIDGAVREADQNRPDIKADEAAVRFARESVKAAIGEYYPSVSIDLDYYLHKDSFPTNIEWSSLLAVNLPIFDAGQIRADVREAWSRLRVALYTEWLLIRQVDHDVKSAWFTTDYSRMRIIELQTEVAASQEALRQSVQRYTVGLAVNLDVLTAQDTLLSSQLDLATEEFNHKMYYLDLLRSMGRLGLPTSLNSMAAGPTSKPTTAQTMPLVPGYEIPPMSVPGLSQSTQPTTEPAQAAPASSPATEPAESRTRSTSAPTTQPTTTQ